MGRITAVTSMAPRRFGKRSLTPSGRNATQAGNTASQVMILMRWSDTIIHTPDRHTGPNLSNRGLGGKGVGGKRGPRTVEIDPSGLPCSRDWGSASLGQVDSDPYQESGPRRTVTYRSPNRNDVPRLRDRQSIEDLHSGSEGASSVTSYRDQSPWSVPHGGIPRRDRVPASRRRTPRLSGLGGKAFLMALSTCVRPIATRSLPMIHPLHFPRFLFFFSNSGRSYRNACCERSTPGGSSGLG